MFCTKCGNKIPPNTTICKFCGYEMTEDDDDEVAKVTVVVPPTNKQPQEKASNTNIVNKIFVIFSIALILIPFAILPIAYIGYKLTLFFIISCIIAVFIELLGTHLLNNLLEDKRRLLIFSKYCIYLSVISLVFAATFIITSISMGSGHFITQYQNLLASIISIGILSIIFPITCKLLIKYS